MDNAEHIGVSISPVAQQTNGTDCGVYAIAFATALCNNLDPTSLKFNRRAIRDHHWQALQCGHLSTFPFEKRRPQDQNKLVRISVYCECRMPYNPAKSGSTKNANRSLTKFSNLPDFNGGSKRARGSRGNQPMPHISTSS